MVDSAHKAFLSSEESALTWRTAEQDRARELAGVDRVTRAIIRFASKGIETMKKRTPPVISGAEIFAEKLFSEAAEVVRTIRSRPLERCTAATLNIDTANGNNPIRPEDRFPMHAADAGIPLGHRPGGNEA